MSRVVSVNVGLPQDVSWQGRIVRTAIWKRPVAGRVTARRLNIDGDGQGDLGGHGGEHRAVMVYQTSSYRYWQTVLGRHDFEYGQFGENLTVDGLADNEVCIGDRYKIGGALFEVTQPRVTCYRVGIRMNHPQMPSLLVSHRRPGFYFRVLEEGEIGAGDEIITVSRDAQAVSVAEVDALLYLPGHPRDRINKALLIPALSAGWKQSLKDLALAEPTAGNAGLAPPASPPLWTGFRPMRVASVRQESVDVRSFVIEAEDQSPLPPFLPGQHLVFQLATDGKATGTLRSYSLSGPQKTGTYRVSIKRAAGSGSRFFHDRIQAGSILRVSAPRGTFTLATGDDGPVVFLSAGIGVTPVLSMLHALAASASQREIWWCHGARNGSEHAFAAEVRDLLTRLPHSHSLVAYSQPENTDHSGKDYDVKGHLTPGLLQGLPILPAAHFFVCGPAPFLRDLESGLRAWGVPGSRIHSETFGPGDSLTPGIASKPAKAPHPPEGKAGTGASISFTRSGLTVPWNPRFGTLLDFAEACNIPVKWACRSGVCHTCESGLIDGTVRYSPQPLDLPAGGNVLICCASPQSDIALDL